MKTKNISISLLLIAGCLTFTSCDQWLKEEPQSFIGPGSIEDSQNGVDMWVTGVYSNWLDDMFRWSEFPFVLELDSDYISGPDWLLSNLGAGNFQGESSLGKMWKGPYNMISDANVAQRYIEAMKNVDEAYKANALGELYFQEAFCYFLLVRAYGPIPYLETDVMDGNEYSNPRQPVNVIYGHIIEMLEKAADMMFSRGDSRWKPGHVNAGSAAGLLAKVYATMASAAMPENTPVTVRTGDGVNSRYTAENENGESVTKYRDIVTNILYKQKVAGYEEMDSEELYGKAAEWAKKVIDGKYGVFELSDYNALWKKTNRNASEFMFGIQSVNGETIYCTNVHTYYSGYTANASSKTLQSGGWVGCTYNWYRLFDEDDLRITDGVRHYWQYYYQTDYDGFFYYPQSWEDKVAKIDDGHYYQYSADYQCLAFTTKYDDVEDVSTKYADSNWPFLRYADVLLVYAEALNELGRSDEAMLYLNRVRARSKAVQMESVLGKDAMRSAIIEERAKELACEGDRRWDLLRWGIYIDAMNAVMYDDSGIYKERSQKHLLYPIPIEEINSNSAITENNFGWN